ncbi:hypothetical protein E0T84_22060 [Mycobacterium sp. DBP42]|nr:hypothetical protein E0T84_22060 [Mycobacterium sp. DBP42]
MELHSSWRIRHLPPSQVAIRHPELQPTRRNPATKPSLRRG